MLTLPLLKSKPPVCKLSSVIKNCARTVLHYLPWFSSVMNQPLSTPSKMNIYRFSSDLSTFNIPFQNQTEVQSNFSNAKLKGPPKKKILSKNSN